MTFLYNTTFAVLMLLIVAMFVFIAIGLQTSNPTILPGGAVGQVGGLGERQGLTYGNGLTQKEFK